MVYCLKCLGSLWVLIRPWLNSTSVGGYWDASLVLTSPYCYYLNHLFYFSLILQNTNCYYLIHLFYFSLILQNTNCYYLNHLFYFSLILQNTNCYYLIHLFYFSLILQNTNCYYLNHLFYFSTHHDGRTFDFPTGVWIDIFPPLLRRPRFCIQRGTLFDWLELHARNHGNCHFNVLSLLITIYRYESKWNIFVTLSKGNNIILIF